MFATKIPKWVEALILKLVTQFVTPEVVAEAFTVWKTEFIAWAKSQVANTANQIDDFLVDKLSQALTVCEPDAQMLCDLMQRGEEAVVELLRGLAAKTETDLDDAAVDVFAEALKQS